MYYNIKIKSQQSEFTLESNDKNVTQREMDIYFAYIFDASESFKSKIKKIVLNNENLKSIEDIEKLAKEARIKKENIIQNEIIEQSKSNTLNPENHQSQNIAEISQRNEKDTYINSESDKFKNTKNSISQNNTQITPDKSKNTSTYIESKNIEKKEPLKTIELSEKAKQNITSKNTIDEILKLAKNEISLIDLSHNETSKTINIGHSQYDENYNNGIIRFEVDKERASKIKNELIEQRELYRNKNQTKINDIFSISNASENEKLIEECNKQNIVSIKQNEDNYSLLQDEKSHTNTLAEENQAILQNTANNDKNDNDKISLDEVQINLSKTGYNDKYIGTKPEIELKEENTQAPYIEFNIFLAGFFTTELIDEFLICAYYIKNILHKEDFTMKFLNSKLFPATGKIADMTITAALIEKGYIKSIDNGDSVTYSITPEGENYYTQALRVGE